MNRGPSPSLNNIREDEPQLHTPTNVVDQQTLFYKSNDQLTCTLKHLETTLTRTNERLDAHEKQLNFFRNQVTPFPSSYLQYVLIILVAIILKYIFH